MQTFESIIRILITEIDLTHFNPDPAANQDSTYIWRHSFYETCLKTDLDLRVSVFINNGDICQSTQWLFLVK